MLSYNRIYENVWNLVVSKLWNDWKKGGGKGEGLTQEEIAEKTGVSQRSVSRYLNEDPGKRISFLDVAKILTAYGVSMSELVEATGDKELAKLLKRLIDDPDRLMKMAHIADSDEGWNAVASMIDLTYNQISK